MSSLTIVLADDHAVVRQGLRKLLESELDCQVQGEASNGWEALKLVEQFKPRILIVDMVMGGLNGLEVIKRVRQSTPQTQIIVLSMHSDESYVREALRAGALGYVLKESKSNEF